MLSENNNHKLFLNHNNQSRPSMVSENNNRKLFSNHNDQSRPSMVNKTLLVSSVNLITLETSNVYLVNGMGTTGDI